MESQLLCSSVLDNSDKILDIDIIKNWVNTVSQFTNPDDIVWCNGSEDEYNQITSQMIKNGTLIALNNLQYPNCYLYRSDINDVARAEHLTFICTTKKEDTGPINNWLSPKDAKAIINPILKNSMAGRTMYVVPYLLGPPNSDFTQIGVEITDSPYVVLNLKIMTRMGSIALDQLNKYDNFVKGVHATHNLDPKQRYICHFPEENLILSVGSGYGGNALLSKKCHALRIASVNARKENWLAEHMLIMGIEKPDGDITYLTGAFPSGCGKTTTGRCILQLYEPTEGEVVFEGQALTQLNTRSMRAMRRQMQVIFQDPFSSLNPRMTAGNIIGEPLIVHGLVANKVEYKERVAELLNNVGLNPYMADRFPHEFSGGQRQRIGVARALSVDPKFIVCDEPVSALDVSIQAQIINLLEDLQDQFNLTYLFIAHDLSVVRHISDRVAVMYLGKMVEIADRNDIYVNPLHPYTQALLSAVPIPDPVIDAQRERVLLSGEVPSPLNPPSGCVFHPRCPIATDECSQVEPELRQVEPGHWAACIKSPGYGSY